MYNRSGFTLVEILIVVVILGILAVVTVPKFTEAADDARESSLATSLHVVRKQLELYRVQHGGDYPRNMNKMTVKTTAQGKNGGDLGPYLTDIPANPFVERDTAVKVDTRKKGKGNCGWYYNKKTGEFAPDDDAHKDM